METHRDRVTVIGREAYFYVLHFENQEDFLHVCEEGPWSVEGALLIVERWRQNIVPDSLGLDKITIRVQLHGLPLEYQYPAFAIQLGQMISLVDRVDWEPDLPRNIRFMRVRVQIDPWLPVFAGFMLNLDDGTKQWIQCRYERVFKVCTKCGLLGHKRTQCPISQEEIKYMIHRQRIRLERNFHVQFDFDVLMPHFVNEIRAIYNRQSRRTTQIRFGMFSSHHHTPKSSIS